MGKRRSGRLLAIQSLYLVDTSKLNAEEALAVNLHPGADYDDDAAAFGRALVLGTVEHQKDLDAYITKHAKNWELSRMAAVDRSLLRLASYELLHQPDTPVNVVINEAIELAKEFSSGDSSKFINGILDKIKDYRGKNGEPA